jgi:hypothetical protein
MMKIGFIISHFSLRYDIRNFVQEIDKRCDLTIYIPASSVVDIKLLSKKYFVVPLPNLKNSYKNKILAKFYDYFGDLPLIRRYFIDYSIRSSYHNNFFRRMYNLVRIKLKLILPKFISFDSYLDRIDNYIPKKFNDQDAFISITGALDLNIYSLLKQYKKKHYSYVHSWDHPAKYNRFSKNSINYLVWSEDLKDDLILLHGINQKNISVVGSTQLCTVHK